MFSNDIPSVDNTGDPSEDREADVDEEIGVASSLQENCERWEEDGEDVGEHVVLEGVSLFK